MKLFKFKKRVRPEWENIHTEIVTGIYGGLFNKHETDVALKVDIATNITPSKARAYIIDPDGSRRKISLDYVVSLRPEIGQILDEYEIKY